MNPRTVFALAIVTSLFSCNKNFDKEYWEDKFHQHKEDPSSFEEIGSIDIGEAGAAEISAFDPKTKRLFVVNNAGINKIDVIDLKDPTTMSVIASIPIDKYEGAVNSLDVHDGRLAAAIEAGNKQQPGKAVIFSTSDYAEIKVVPVGALPDMIHYSPDGKYILTANEGEPNSDYTMDPEGTVSIISVDQGYSVVNVDFSSFEGQLETLKAKGFRVFGPGASLSQDVEPEYITISKDSKTAWVTLQENNAIAKINLQSKEATDIFPLGFKEYNIEENGIDPSDEDDQVFFRKVPVFGMYQPDAIAFLEKGGKPYLFTVNEGDVREYDAFTENERIKNIVLDETVFPDAEDLQKDEALGRLNITKTLGDKDGDGKYESLYSFGARSFSVWDGDSGDQLFDSRHNLEEATADAGYYDDGRSDDKGVEPEGIAIGKCGSKEVAFIGMERADAVAVYDVSFPTYPRLLKILKTGDAPEGILFIDADDSPVKKSLLVVSSEDDGVVTVYATSRE